MGLGRDGREDERTMSWWPRGSNMRRKLEFHGIPAVIPTVEGVASFTGRHTFLLEPDDPLGEGLLVRLTWA